MKAMIFAAGLGTRLKPLTDSTPKALVAVAGKPLLEHVINKLKKAGFDEILINVHHFPDQIIDFVKEHHNFGIRIEFSDERHCLLDTGGGIRKASEFFNDGQPFLVHNVDILSNVDLEALYQFHLNEMPLATLVVSERETSRYLLFDNGLYMDEFAHCGIFKASPGVFRYRNGYLFQPQLRGLFPYRRIGRCYPRKGL